MNIYWEIGDGVEWGMVAGPEAELVLQRSGVLRQGFVSQLVSFIPDVDAR